MEAVALREADILRVPERQRGDPNVLASRAGDNVVLSRAGVGDLHPRGSVDTYCDPA